MQHGAARAAVVDGAEAGWFGHSCSRKVGLTSAGGVDGFVLSVAVSLIATLHFLDVLGVLVARALEDLLDLSDFPVDFLVLFFGLLVVALDHVDELVDVVAGHDDVAHFLLGLHLLPHHERVHLLLGNHTRTNGHLWILLYLLSQLLCELNQLGILLDGLKTLVRVRNLKLRHWIRLEGAPLGLPLHALLSSHLVYLVLHLVVDVAHAARLRTALQMKHDVSPDRRKVCLFAFITCVLKVTRTNFVKRVYHDLLLWNSSLHLVWQQASPFRQLCAVHLGKRNLGEGRALVSLGFLILLIRLFALN